MQNAWVTSLVSVILTLPIYMMYARIGTLYPGNSLFFTVRKIFGKAFGGIIILIFCLYAFFLGSMWMRIFAEFNQVVSMPETSQMLTFTIFGAVCIYILKKGIGTLAGFSTLSLAVIIFLIVLINILSLSQWKLHYLEPLFQLRPSVFWDDVWVTAVFPLGEAVLITTLFGFTKNSPKKPLLWGLGIGGLMLVIEILRSVAVLGPGTISLLYYPSYTATGVINIMDFFSRVEVTISASFFVAQIIKVCICIYAVSSGLGSLLNAPSYKTLTLPVIFTMIALGSILFKNTADSYEFLQIYKYFAPVFQLILPAIIWIGAEISARRDRRLASPF